VFSAVKIVIDGEVFHWQKRGGVSRIYTEILPRLRALDPDLRISVVVQGLPRSRVLSELRARIEYIPSVPVRLRPWVVRYHLGPKVDALTAELYWRLSKADVFHPTYYTWRPVSAPGFCFVYDMMFELFPDIFDRKYGDMIRSRKKAAIEQARLVLCISETTRRDVVNLLRVPETKCRVVHLAGFSDRKLENMKAVRTEHDKPFLLYVGDYKMAYKNFEFLLECLGSRGFAEFSEFDLVVAAPYMPTEEEFTRYSRLIGMNRVRFLTGCDDKQLIRLYSGCSVFVLPSLYEGFGIPVLEALSVGAPVACSHCSALREVGRASVCYFDPRSPRDLCSALGRALSEGRNAPRVESRQREAARFSWDRTARGFCAAIKDVAG